VFFELTEILTCPRCGPAHGLILLVEDARDRRVYAGWLGCPACGNDYPVREGVADLRLEPASEVDGFGLHEEDELPVKVAALSGLTEGSEYLLIDPSLRHVAGAVADLLPEVEVVAFGLDVAGSSERHGVSRILTDRPFPVAAYRLRAAATASASLERLAGAARTVGPGGRFVMFDAGDAAVGELGAWGFELLAREGRTAVAERKSYDPCGAGGR
jgi:uncharacterized protein YbaR (Trm112 family)